MTADRDTRALDAIEHLVAESEEADALLRGVVAILAESYAAGCGIRFVEEGAWSLGPWNGTDDPVVADVAVRYDDEIVAELITTTALDDTSRLTWERVANLIAPYCLVGWDTGGEDWEP